MWEAEVYALVLAFHYGILIADMAALATGKNMYIEVATDSKTLFRVVPKDGTTTEQRLQIYILALKEAYSKGEFTRMTWIPSVTNPADALTMNFMGRISPLWCLMKSNVFIPAQLGGAVDAREGDGTRV